MRVFFSAEAADVSISGPPRGGSGLRNTKEWSEQPPLVCMCVENSVKVMSFYGCVCALFRPACQWNRLIQSFTYGANEKYLVAF